MTQHATTGPVLLEVAVASVADAVAADRAGADRIELSTALDVGGLTPSIGLIRAVRQAVQLPLIVLVRPRAGGFCYSADELAVMQADLAAAREAGADGAAVGVLREDGTVDEAACRALAQAAAGWPLVFHRAFDVVRDRSAALERIIELGFVRLLTGGGRRTVPPPSPGAKAVRALIEQAAGRIEVLPAGGIRAANVAKLIRVTGCTQVHASCRRKRRTAGAPPGKDTFGFGLQRDAMDEGEVRALRLAIAAVRSRTSV